MEIEDFDIWTMRERFAELGDVHAAIDDVHHDLAPLLELYERQGEGEAPYPPQFAKQEGEPLRSRPSVAGPAAAKRARPRRQAAGRGRRRPGPDAVATAGAQGRGRGSPRAVVRQPRATAERVAGGRAAPPAAPRRGAAGGAARPRARAAPPGPASRADGSRGVGTGWCGPPRRADRPGDPQRPSSTVSRPVRPACFRTRVRRDRTRRYQAAVGRRPGRSDVVEVGAAGGDLGLGGPIAEPVSDRDELPQRVGGVVLPLGAPGLVGDREGPGGHPHEGFAAQPRASGSAAPPGRPGRSPGRRG